MNQEEKEIRIKELIESAKFGSPTEFKEGGQTTGSPKYGVYMIVQDVGFFIEIDASRSQITNKQLCVDTFKKFMELILKEA